MPRYFDDLELGEVLLSPHRAVTPDDVTTFAALTGDWNDLHLNEEFARQGPFGRRIAHGALIFSLSVGLLQNDPSRTLHLIAFIGVDRLRFNQPVFLDDTIQVKQTVRSLDVVNKQSGIVDASHQVLNQNGKIVLTYTAKFLVHRRPAGTVPGAA